MLFRNILTKTLLNHVHVTKFNTIFPKLDALNGINNAHGSVSFGTECQNNGQDREENDECILDEPLHRVTMIKGNALGPELMEHVLTTVTALNSQIKFDIFKSDAYAAESPEFYEQFHNAIDSIRHNKVAIIGNMDTSNQLVGISPNIILRNELDLFVNITHFVSYPAIPTKYKNIDIVLCRQNTEGEYSSMEHMTRPGHVETLKVITRKKSMEIARYTFEQAKKLGRKNVTTVHKANIMKMTDGLFLECAREVAKEYKGSIGHNSMIVDNVCMQLVSKPQQFDVILLPNLYGSVVSNVLAGLTGGAGISAGANLNQHYAVFEVACRSLGLGLVGKDIANPVAILNATANMLEYLGQIRTAKILRSAILKTICIDGVRTYDVGGNNTSSEVMQSIIDNITFTKSNTLFFDT